MKKSLKQNAFGIPLIIILTLVVSVLYARYVIMKRTEDSLELTLKTMQENTTETVNTWAELQVSNVKSILADKVIQDRIDFFLTEHQAGRQVAETIRAENRSRFNQWTSAFGFLGMDLIDPKGIVVFSSDKRFAGRKHNFMKQLPEQFATATRGQSGIVPPLQTDIPVIDPLGEMSGIASVMYAYTPVIRNGRVVAVMAVRLNAYAEFTALFARGRTGLSGETYALNSEGRLISESRFRSELMKIGLLQQDYISMRSFFIQKPPRQDIHEVPLTPEEALGMIEGRGEFTEMAQSLLNKDSGQNLKGYSDYRGIEVIGLWTWNNRYNFGYATEIDADEAYALMEMTLLVIYILAGLSIALIIGLSVQDYLRHHRDILLREKLQTALDNQEKANKAKSVFMSSMSHELRTPLNSIIGFGTLLKQEAEAGNHKSMIEKARYITESGAHLLTLVNDVLDFAKIESGVMQLSCSSLDVNDLINSSLHMTESMAMRKSITINYSAADTENLKVWADLGKARQVLINIISNALKYNRKDGFVYISAEQQDDWIKIMIRDTGMGIAPEALKDIWEPFNRSGAERGTVEGSGIGLALTRQLVQAMGGQITVSSTLGQGSCFVVHLPTATPKQREEATVSAAKADQTLANPEETTRKHLTSKKIIYVEDVVLNQKVFGMALKGINDLEIDYALTGEQGVELLRTATYDLVVLDLNLPDMTGLDVYLTAKKEGRIFAPVVAMTADAFPETASVLKKAGFYDVISKPIDVTSLADKLGKIMLENGPATL